MPKMDLLWLLLCMDLLLYSDVLLVNCKEPPTVLTKYGLIYGKRLKYLSYNVDAFLGVPYAKPPVGALRFQEPKPVESWEYPIHATNFAPACPQYTEYPDPSYDALNQNEDCLYLNVYIPRTSLSGLLTVMFWIYGGSYQFGSNKLDLYDGRALAATGNVIVVTVNYRLGPLGFLFANTTDAPGNMGILDQVEALKWVRGNIESFDGDKDSITIFGESAGAISVAIFTLSPLTRGLYNRAIIESFSQQFHAENAKTNFGYGQQLAAAVNCSNGGITLADHPHLVLRCLRGVRASILIKEYYKIQPYFSFVYQDTGKLAPRRSIIETIRKSRFHNSDLLIGFNSNEGGVVATIMPDIFGYFGEKNPKLNKTLASELLQRIPTKGDMNELTRHYFGDLNEYDFADIKQRFFRAVGDVVIICDTIFYGELFAKHNNVYFYEFDYRPINSVWDIELGVIHSQELEFVFGKPNRHPFQYQKKDISLSGRMMKLWTTFAKHGYPEENYPKFSRSHPFVQVLNSTYPAPVMVVPYLKDCNYLRKEITVSMKKSCGKQ